MRGVFNVLTLAVIFAACHVVVGFSLGVLWGIATRVAGWLL